MQVWLAEQIGIRENGYRSLGRCWANWADTCDPVSLFSALRSVGPGILCQVPGVADRPADTTLLSWLPIPGTRRLLSCPVFSDSVKRDADDPKTGALVFDTPEAMQRFRVCNAALRYGGCSRRQESSEKSATSTAVVIA